LTTRVGIVELCDALRDMIASAHPAKRAAFVDAFDGYAARYPVLWPLLQGPQTPSFFYHIVGDLIETGRQLTPVGRPTSGATGRAIRRIFN
jgi:hypothetical protein